MGIPRLTSSLEPYAIRSQLSGRVVIDGPAFAYHVLYICRRQCRTKGPLNEPTYSQLADAALQWMNGLEECGITISAIYFDGYLPGSKRDVRLERVYTVSQTLSNYYSSTTSGVPSMESLNEARESLNPFQAVSSRKNNQIPIPAFLVPSVLEGLRASTRYQDITHLVPGEADSFCADDVRRRGGTILTSDSDLLLYDLGPEGSVAFLKDVEFTTASIPKTLAAQGSRSEPTPTTVSGLNFSAARIRERLSLASEDGLLSLGFELQTDPYPPFPEVVKRSKAKHSSSKNRNSYADFVSQYQNDAVSDIKIPVYLSHMDPRVSEFVLQWTGDAVGPQAETRETADDDITIFLPSLLDSWGRTSAWDASAWIRQLAYGLMRLYNARKGLSSVIEYRRTHSKISKGRHIGLPLPMEIVESGKELLSMIQKVKQEPDLQQHQWIILAMQQDILRGNEEDRESLSLEMWKLAAKSYGQLDPTTWNSIHFAAQLQGTLYSLRILQQVLGLVQQGVGDALPEYQQQLKQELDLLPSISEFPTIRDVSTLFFRLKQTGALKNLMGISRIPGDIPFETPRARKRRKREEGKKTKGAASPVQKAGSSRNLFDVLG